MPKLSDALGQDLSAYVEAPKSSPQAAVPPSQTMAPDYNSMIRCSLPTIFQTSPDNLRQFYQNQVPQIRLFNPAGNGAPTGGSGGEVGLSFANVGASTSGGGSGGNTGPSTSKQISVTSGILNPMQLFQGTIQMAKSFQLLNAGVNSAARIQLYGTQSSQQGDSTRVLDAPPPAGTIQNIICDVALDSIPLNWSFQDRVGANADSPQTVAIYVTLTNLATTSTSITLTLVYVPLES